MYEHKIRSKQKILEKTRRSETQRLRGYSIFEYLGTTADEKLRKIGERDKLENTGRPQKRLMRSYGTPK